MTRHTSETTTMQVVVDGDLDLFAACHVRKELHRHARHGAARLCVDLSMVPWTNASALRHLAITRADLGRRPGVTVVVTGASAAVERISSLARLDDALGHLVA